MGGIARPDRLPATRWDELLPPRTSTSTIQAWRRKQLSIVGNGAAPFVCQQYGERKIAIATAKCLLLQPSPNCLGCARPSHLCHWCGLERVKFQEIELGASCLSKALVEEAERGMPEFPADTSLYCQRVKGSIDLPTCLRMQSQQTDEEECLWCIRQTYRCQLCGHYPSRYPNLGLCLHCTVDQFDYRPNPKVEAFLQRMLAIGPPPKLGICSVGPLGIRRY